MKKLFSVLTGILLMGSVAFGQTTTATSKAKTETRTTTTAMPHLKKDGTPDKRYKDNSPKLKKDGTPDMRYKANQTKTTTTTKTTN
jgi:hypothetical protein